MFDEERRGSDDARTLWTGLLTVMLLAGSLGALASGAAADSPVLDAPETCETDHPQDIRVPRPVPAPQPLLNGTDCWDYGDAPDSSDRTGGLYTSFYTAGGADHGWFPTLSDTANSVYGNQPGARHRTVDVGWLGNVSAYRSQRPGSCTELADLPPTLEHDADATPDQDLITNLDPNTQTPDHDGQDNGLYRSVFFPGQDGEVRFRVSSDDGIEEWHVNVLADWDYDGSWDHEDEWIVRNHVVSVPALQSCVFEAHVPDQLVGTAAGTPWVRITLTQEHIDHDPDNDGFPSHWDGSVPPTYLDNEGDKAFEFGETEDYCGRISVNESLEGNETIRCQREDNDEPGDDDCSNDQIDKYTVDISTGWDQGQVSLYTQDDDWYVWETPNQVGQQPVYAIQAHPWGVWEQPNHGRWINPYGDQFYSSTYENNWISAPTGDYVYRAEFALNDPDAAQVKMDFTWWRDDSSTQSQTADGFAYKESSDPPTWTPISFGAGFNPSAGTPVSYLDATPESVYEFQVEVHNAMTFTGLLVEGEMTVFCEEVDEPTPLTP